MSTGLQQVSQTHPPGQGKKSPRLFWGFFSLSLESNRSYSLGLTPSSYIWIYFSHQHFHLVCINGSRLSSTVFPIWDLRRLTQYPQEHWVSGAKEYPVDGCSVLFALWDWVLVKSRGRMGQAICHLREAVAPAISALQSCGVCSSVSSTTGTHRDWRPWSFLFPCGISKDTDLCVAIDYRKSSRSQKDQ